ncbi:MAG: amidohydrolase family protein [Chloroflexota bacterium]|nr:amidohydrolase family protein [Chloroflexota bacterium]
MVIDVHTHTPRFETAVPEGFRDCAVNAKWNPAGARPLVYTWAEYDAAMAPVERTIVFNIAQNPQGNEGVDEPYVVPAPQVNDETAAFVRSNPEKYIGFFSVHPDDPGMLDEAERARTDLGLKGLKLGLNYQNVDPLGENAFRLYAYAEAHGLPMLLHQGTSPVRFADIDFGHPRHTDRIAMAFPKLTIIMAHVGHPFCLDALVVARKHPQVWADISGCVLRPWGLYGAMTAALEWGVLDRLLFGSDYPASTPEETMRLLRAVNDAHPGGGAPRIPEEAIEAIIARDSLALLGLD